MSAAAPLFPGEPGEAGSGRVRVARRAAGRGRQSAGVARALRQRCAPLRAQVSPGRAAAPSPQPPPRSAPSRRNLAGAAGSALRRMGEPRRMGTARNGGTAQGGHRGAGPSPRLFPRGNRGPG